MRLHSQMKQSEVGVSCFILSVAMLTIYAKVSTWDAELLQNQQKIGELADDVRRLQITNKELDSNLTTITSYQQELRTSLEVSILETCGD